MTSDNDNVTLCSPKSSPPPPPHPRAINNDWSLNWTVIFSWHKPCLINQSCLACKNLLKKFRWITQVKQLFKSYVYPITTRVMPVIKEKITERFKFENKDDHENERELKVCSRIFSKNRQLTQVPGRMSTSLMRKPRHLELTTNIWKMTEVPTGDS